jgi:uncharacterized protein YabN with tetrapyrrole methylase and pyrophosphatase domain
VGRVRARHVLGRRGDALVSSRNPRSPASTAAASRHGRLRLIGGVDRGGSLTVVGTGISLGVQLTPQARHAIEGADETLYLLADAGSGYWIEQLRPDARSLHPLYPQGGLRVEIYEEIVEAIVTPVRAGKRVCAALYGHPGIADFIGHESVRRARSEGFDATMLPGVSAVDCLFAEFGLDPATSGCQIYEATDFVLYRRGVDTSAALVLLQVAVVGAWRAEPGPNREGLRVLGEYLRELYAADHEAILYEASPYPVADSVINRIRLDELDASEPAEVVTLYVPPARSALPDPEVVQRLAPATPI